MADPVDRQEQALAAVFAALVGIGGGVNAYRNPEFELGDGDYPCVLQVDGGDEPLDQVSGVLTLAVRVTVGLVAQKPTGAELGTELRRLRRLVRVALADSFHDGGLAELARDVRYEGSDDPVTVADGEAAPVGVWPVHFVVELDEAEGDPAEPL